MSALWCAALLSALPAAAAADVPAATAGLGGAGVWSVPSARMAPVGSLTLGSHYASPDWHIPLFLQPTERLALGLRYTQRLPRGADGARRHYDPQLDLAWQLWEETPYRPALVAGLRDGGHVSPFSAEYLVASKRAGPWDVSLGVGWGALGSAADAEAPLNELSSRYDRRPTPAERDAWSGSQLLRGPAALFGGVVYQTPWQPLRLALEYTGGDARYPHDDAREQSGRWQGGAHLSVAEPLTLHVGWEREETLGAGLSWQFDLAGAPRSAAAPPLPVSPLPAAPTHAAALARQLEEQAGLRVHELRREGDALVVVATPGSAGGDTAAMAESLRRANALLDAGSDASVQRFRYRWERGGLLLREDVHLRSAVAAAERSSGAEAARRHGVYAHAQLLPLRGEPLHETSRERFSWSLSPQLLQNAGSPSGYRYRLSGLAEGRYETAAAGWFSGGVDYTLAENLTRPAVDPLSDVTPNRSLRGYSYTRDPGLDHLTYQQATALGGSWYALGYGGWLEAQYAGAGGELLYRPLGSPLAWGLNAARVRPRAFERDLALRGESTWTGQASAYLYLDDAQSLLLEAGLNRYLGGDSGLSLGVTQSFDSGVALGLAAAFSQARDHRVVPELSVTLPLTLLGPAPRRHAAELRWQTLDSDSGSVLERPARLFELTEERRVRGLW